MCFDFRHDPTGVRVIDTGEVFPVNTVWLKGVQDMKSVTDAGMYGIPATGSYFCYYDGNHWHADSADYGKSGYEFLRPEGRKGGVLLNDLDFTVF